MKKTLFILVILVIIFVSGIAYIKWRQESAFARLLPEGGLFYVTVKNPGRLWEKMACSPACKDLLSSGELGSLRAEKEAIESKIGANLATEFLPGLLGRRMSLSIFAAEKSLDALLITFLKPEQTKGVTRMLACLSGDNQAERYRDVRIKGLRKGGLSYCIYKNKLFIGTDRGLIKKSVDIHCGQSNKSLHHCPQFRKVSAKLPGRGDLVYLDIDKLSELASKSSAKFPGGCFPLNTCFSAMGSRSFFGKRGILGTSYVLFGESAPPELLKLYSEPAKVPRALSCFPEQCTSVNWLGIDLAAYLRLLEGHYQKVRPRGTGSIFSSIRPEEDIFPWLGREVSYGMVDIGMRGFLPSVKPAFLIEVSDMGKAEISLAKIRGLVETELSKHFEKGKFAFKKKKYNKENIYFLGTPQMPGFGPHYALVNNLLLVTLDENTARKMLDLLKGEGKDSICNDPDFLEVNRCKRCNSLTYINAEDTFEGIAGLAEYALRLRGGSDLERLSFLPALLRCFTIVKTIGSKAVHEPDGIRENFTILLNLED